VGVTWKVCCKVGCGWWEGWQQGRSRSVSWKGGMEVCMMG